jgi:hypothetical protein
MPAVFGLVAGTFAVVPLLAQDAAQRSRQLQPIDMFLLGVHMVMGAEEPKSRQRAVEVPSGQRQPYAHLFARFLQEKL